jgi:hypothetical protein
MDDWEDYSNADLSGVNSWLQERGWYGLTVRPSLDGSELEFYGGIAEEEDVIRDNTTFLSPDDSPEDFHEDILEKLLKGLERGTAYEWDNIPEDIRTPEMVFGTTENVRLAGYLTPEGRFLDFSGGTGSRELDHRQIGMAEGRGSTSGMREFMNKGNIRLLPGAPSFEIIRPPTWEQRESLKQFIAELGSNGMSVEFQDGLGEFDERNDLYSRPSRRDHKEYPPRVRPEEILRDIGNFFSPVSPSREAWVLRNCKFASGWEDWEDEEEDEEEEKEEELELSDWMSPGDKGMRLWSGGWVTWPASWPAGDPHHNDVADKYFRGQEFDAQASISPRSAPPGRLSKPSDKWAVDIFSYHPLWSEEMRSAVEQASSSVYGASIRIESGDGESFQGTAREYTSQYEDRYEEEEEEEEFAIHTARKEVEEAFMTSGPAPGATHRGKKCRVCGPDGEELIGKFSPSLKGEKYIHPFRAPRKKKRKKKRSKATSWVSRNCRFA